jgi:uncharacterized repeat protein (TIGR02543 family)
MPKGSAALSNGTSYSVLDTSDAEAQAAGMVNGIFYKTTAEVEAAAAAAGVNTSVKVTFEGEGFTSFNKFVEKGKAIAKPTEPTRDGYDVTWYTDAGLTQAYNFDTPVNADLTLYAGWSRHFYTVDFNYGIASGGGVDSVPYGEKLTDFDLTLDGYDFGGWYTDAECTQKYDFNTPVTSDFTLYAKWAIHYYIVTFDDGIDGTTNATASIPYEYKVSEPTAPTRDGYDFGGWYTDETCTDPSYNFNKGVKADFTLHAKWVIQKRTVTFSDGVNDPTSETVDYDTTVAEPSAPTRDGYDFGGWYTDAECTQAYDFAKPVTDDLTLHAKWSRHNYVVTFDDGIASTVDATASVPYEDKLSEPTAPTCVGYDFGGWYTDEGCAQAYDFDTPVTADLTLYAKWVIQQRTVSFSDGDPASETVDYGGTVTKPDDPTRDGYVFGGWYTDTECTQAYDFDTLVTADITLYAKWTKSEPRSIVTPTTPDTPGTTTDSTVDSTDDSTSCPTSSDALPTTADANGSLAALAGMASIIVLGCGLLVRRTTR